MLRSIAIILLLFSVSKLPAQSPFNQYYDIENIFSKELIKGIAKDEEGFVWVATDEGVVRFDGHETNYFYKELPSPYTKEFLKRKNGQFLIIHDRGIKEIVNENDSIYFRDLVIGDQTFDQVLNYPKSIFEDSEENIWIGEIDAVVRINEKGFKRFYLGSDFQTISYHHSFSFTEDAFGNIWIAPFKGPLLAFDKESDSLKTVNTDYDLSEGSGIITVKGDYLLLSGKEGLLKLKIDSDKAILDQEFIDQVDHISSLEAIDQHIYLGTWDEGLYYTNFDNSPLTIEQVEEVPVLDILDFYFDQDNGELWIAGGENVGLLERAKVNELEKIGNLRIESLSFDNDNNYYYSVAQQVLILDELRYGEVRELYFLEDSYFANIYIDQDTLWIGDASGRIFFYELGSDQRVDLWDYQNISITQIYKDQNGYKWFAGRTDGLIRVSPTNDVKLFDNIQQSVLVKASHDGKLFCATSDLDRMLMVYSEKDSSFTPLDLNLQFDISHVFQLNDLSFDLEDNIWLGTDDGLLFIKNENGQYKNVIRKHVSGFDINEPIRAIAQSDKFLWLANSFGLVLLYENETILYNRDNGLPSKIIKERGLKYDKEGRLCILTSKGLALLNESEIEISKTSPPIFKSILVNGEDIEKRSSMVFPYNSKLTADFIALSFPGKNLEYQTRVLGIEDDWSEASSNRTLSVINFSEGEYTIQVRARTGGKIWSDPVSYSFSINKPWFKTWWAVIGFILVAVLCVLIAIRIHNRNLILQKKKLKKIIDKRTEEINRQKNEMIEQQKKIIQQKEELLEKKQAVYQSQQALNEADMNFLHLKEKQLEEQIEYKNKQITTHTLNIIQKNETLKELKGKLEKIVEKPEKHTVSEVKKTLKLIDESFRLDKDWDDFKLYFEQIYTGFYAKLKINYPDITNQELRHCALIRLNLSNSECASILGISPDSIKVSRTRLRKKLKLSPNQGLTDFIMGI